ncbi:MAG: hypothetical protein EBX54_12610 [Betaproteobacteria bacterium]|nr:hypothetical protein [Betaproteobacteria bacterium]
MQTAGEALNYHPHLHGLLADGFWKDGVFTRFSEVDLNAIEQAFAERVLAQLHKLELLTDDDVVKILSQDHTGFDRLTPLRIGNSKHSNISDMGVHHQHVFDFGRVNVFAA